MAVSILALIGSVLVSILYYYYSYSTEIQKSQRILFQLGQTVQSTASIAAYLNDRELANEVIQGLKKNEIVSTAQLSNLTGLKVPDVVTAVNITDQTVHLKLESPFILGEAVGELSISMKQELINQRARESAWTNAAMLGGYTLFIALLVFMLIQSRLIAGIKQIASKLNYIVPGQKERLSLPNIHKKDEIGGLVNNINNLLSLVQEKLESESALLRQMESLEKRFRMIYESAGVGIFMMDDRARLAMGNLAFIEIMGAEVYGRNLNDDVNCMINMFSEPEKSLDMLDETFTKGTVSTSDLLIIEADGKERWVSCMLTKIRDESNASAGSPILIQGIIADITERKLEEQRMRFQAERDPLTNLFNRRSAEYSLKLMLEKANYEGSNVAVCLVDLDNFKPINDTYGHDAGDIVLIETAKRMTGTLRNTDLVARLGGDEFLLVLQGASSKQDFEMLLKKLLQAITAEIYIGNEAFVSVGASIGVVLSSEHGKELEKLMVLADHAMYQVKRNGKQGFQFYSPDER
jgi:diguanylate cyclase (GGDEF)-like protein/PAS domain S-box-containing protein